MSKTIKYNGEELNVAINSYHSDPMAMAISLSTQTGEPYATLTKNFGNYVGDKPTGAFIQPNAAFIDVNNIPDAEKILEQMGAKPYKRFGDAVHVESGYCRYPLYEFPPEKLQEFDETGWKKHQLSYRKHIVNEQEKLNREMFVNRLYTTLGYENDIEKDD